MLIPTITVSTTILKVLYLIVTLAPTLTQNPENQTVCLGDTVVVKCGYTNFTLIRPGLIVNGTWYSDTTTNPLFHFVLPRFPNETDDTRIIIGPVDEHFIGATMVYCLYETIPTAKTPTATIKVLG